MRKEVKQVNIISVSEFDQLVQNTYGRVYCFQQQDGCKDRQTVYLSVPCEPEDYDNDTVPENVNDDEMGVSFNAWLSRDPKQKLNTTDSWAAHYSLIMWWERNFYPDVSMVVNDLHAKGLLPEGELGIYIDW